MSIRTPVQGLVSFHHSVRINGWHFHACIKPPSSLITVRGVCLTPLWNLASSLNIVIAVGYFVFFNSTLSRIPPFRRTGAVGEERSRRQLLAVYLLYCSFLYLLCSWNPRSVCLVSLIGGLSKAPPDPPFDDLAAIILIFFTQSARALYCLLPCALTHFPPKAGISAVSGFLPILGIIARLYRTRWAVGGSCTGPPASLF